MKSVHKIGPVLLLLIFVVLFLNPSVFSSPRQPKILIVMSYHEGFTWCSELKKGMDRILSNDYELHYFFMDTKRNLAGGPDKAKAAYELYRKIAPTGVIAADDNAQTMFVVPYLKNKVKTPVIFCGVNGEPSQYGYPGDNVTGVVERFHMRESMALLQQLVPAAKSIGFIMRGDSPTTTAIFNRLKDEAKTYPLIVKGFEEPTSLEKAIMTAKKFAEECDVLFLEHFAGLKDKSGIKHIHESVVKLLVEAYGNKPTICSTEYTVKSGVLCTVVESGVEQGAEASKMLIQALNGTPVSQIPIIRNLKGIQMINVTVMKALGIKPKPSLLRGVKLVKTE